MTFETRDFAKNKKNCDFLTGPLGSSLRCAKDFFSFAGPAFVTEWRIYLQLYVCLWLTKTQSRFRRSASLSVYPWRDSVDGKVSEKLDIESYRR